MLKFERCRNAVMRHVVGAIGDRDNHTPMRTGERRVLRPLLGD